MARELIEALQKLEATIRPLQSQDIDPLVPGMDVQNLKGAIDVGLKVVSDMEAISRTFRRNADQKGINDPDVREVIGAIRTAGRAAGTMVDSVQKAFHVIQQHNW